MPTTIPANNPSRLHRFGFALAKLVKQPLKFATTDKLRWEIITKAINLISAPLTLQDLETLTASVNADHYKLDIIAQATEKNLMPTLTLEQLKTLIALGTENYYQDYKSYIITKAIKKNLISAPLTLQDLQTLTASVNADCCKLDIIKTATEENLMPTLTLQELKTLIALGTENNYQDEKKDIITKAIKNNLISPPLTLQELPELTVLVSGDDYKYAIIKTAIENNLTSTLNLEQLKKLTELVTEDRHKYSIIIAAIEKNLISAPLTPQELPKLTALVAEDKNKCAIFIEALNKGMQLTPENDLECFGLDKDDTKRFEMINCFLKHGGVRTCSALLNLVTLVNYEQKDTMIKDFLKHEGVTTCSALLQLVALVSDEQKNTMIETVFRQKLILEPEIKFLKVAIFCQKLKNLALNPGQTTPAEESAVAIFCQKLKNLVLNLGQTTSAEENEEAAEIAIREAAENAIRKYINYDLFANTRDGDQNNSSFTIKEMGEILGPQKEMLYTTLLGIHEKEIDFFLGALESTLNLDWEEDKEDLRKKFVTKIREEEKTRQLLGEEEQNRQQPSAATPNNSPVAGVCSMLWQISGCLRLCQAG